MTGKTVPRDMETYAKIQNELLPSYAEVYDKALALEKSVEIEKVRDAQVEQSAMIGQMNMIIQATQDENRELRKMLQGMQKKIEALESK